MSVSLPSANAARSIRFGLAVMGLGLLFLIATVIPYFFGVDNRSLWINIGCMLAPAGFVLAVLGSVKSARDGQRAVLAQLSKQP